MLRANAETIRGFGVTSLYVYGSTARNEANPRSDIDLFADVDYNKFGFVEYMDAREYFVGLLGRQVDFTTRNALHRDLRKEILASAVEVFNEAPLHSVAAE